MRPASSSKKALIVTGVASALRRMRSAGDLEDAGVDRVEEVRRLHDGGDAVVDVVVDEERPEQRLLGLDVVGQRVRVSASSAGVVPSAMSFSLRRLIAAAGAGVSRASACG